MNHRRHNVEGMLWGIALVAANIHLVLPVSNTALVFGTGGHFRWWTVLTHPLTHVSLYHLLMDAGAFLCLYPLVRGGASRRLGAVAACGAGSLLISLLVSPAMPRGLCGMSGIDHGLMFLVGLELARTTRVGYGVSVIVGCKAIYEACSGQVFFESLHVGNVGTPLAACHLGGIIGGAVFFLSAEVLARSSRYRTTPRPGQAACARASAQ